MQLVLQVKQVETGANGLKHEATDFSGESSDLNKASVSPRWLMREMWAGARTAHRVSDIKDLDFPTYSASNWTCLVSIPFGDC